MGWIFLTIAVSVPASAATAVPAAAGGSGSDNGSSNGGGDVVAERVYHTFQVLSLFWGYNKPENKKTE